MPTNKPQPIPPGMERPPGLPTSPPPPRVAKPDIKLTIYRDGNGPVYVRGFTTIQQAVEAGEGWPYRLWWRVEQDGKIVAEEPKEVKR